MCRSSISRPPLTERASCIAYVAKSYTGASGAVVKCSANRNQGFAETLARAKQVLAAVSTVLDHSEAIGLTVNQD